MAAIKKILMITTGGTIGGNVADTETAKATQEGKTADDFKSRIAPTLQTIKKTLDIDVEITTQELCNVDSSDILPNHWTKLSEIIHEEYDKYDSFVITHGTNTLGIAASVETPNCTAANPAVD